MGATVVVMNQIITTPAHSPLPDKRDEDLSPQGGAAVNTKPRSKRIYIYWGIALTLLTTVGVFSWLVVVPVLQARSLVRDHLTKRMRSTLYSPPAIGKEDALYCIAKLGGRRRAAQLLHRCLVWCDDGNYVDRSCAISVLARCGDHGVERLRTLARRPGKSLNRYGLNRLAVEGLATSALRNRAALAALQELAKSSNPDPVMQTLAAKRLHQVLYPDIRTKVIDVSSAHKLVALGVGEDSGIRKGLVFLIHRGDEYIGKVRVTTVWKNFCGGTVVERKKPMKAGDDAMTDTTPDP